MKTNRIQINFGECRPLRPHPDTRCADVFRKVWAPSKASRLLLWMGVWRDDGKWFSFLFFHIYERRTVICGWCECVRVWVWVCVKKSKYQRIQKPFSSVEIQMEMELNELIILHLFALYSVRVPLHLSTYLYNGYDVWTIECICICLCMQFT